MKNKERGEVDDATVLPLSHWVVGPEKGRFGGAVQSAALALQRVDDVHGGHGLALGVLGVGDRIADDVLQEDLQHAAGLLVDEAADALDAAAASQSADGRLRDALDVVAEDLAMALGASLAESLASLAAARHDRLVGVVVVVVVEERVKS
ncbi:hypothetical protein TYRP_018138 [Tyrophagus putrescentiae]|nr:hypothetical protein TYRP_018138 [Tyrophagus putrescentiae]